MLHHTQEFACHPRVLFWQSQRGYERFYRFVASRFEVPPPFDDPEIARALAAGLPPRSTAMSDAEVDEYAIAAATNLVERLRHQRLRTAGFHEWVSTPQSMRLMARSSTDRARVQHELSTPSNPHFQRWLDAHVAASSTR